LSTLTQIARILLETLAVFLATTLLVFALIRWLPGDPVTERLGPQASEQDKARLRHEMGLDRPFLIQYIDRLWATLTLDIGISAGMPNAVQLVAGTGVTVRLTLGAAVLLLLLGVPIGVFSGMHPHSVGLSVTNFGIYMLSMVPVFLLGYASFFFFSYVPILSDISEIVAGGRTSLPPSALYAVIFLTMIGVLAIGDGTITELIRSVREETGRILESDFIRAVRANGGAVWKHLAKNLCVPIATVLNLRILYLLGGAVVVESVYEYPGLGSLTMHAVNRREYDLIFSITTVSVLIVLLVTTFNRILIALIDPRARD
jgi:ABC-type dipeptide/oligopeptide/nickel transport system permease component